MKKMEKRAIYIFGASLIVGGFLWTLKRATTEALPIDDDLRVIGSLGASPYTVKRASVVITAWMDSRIRTWMSVAGADESWDIVITDGLRTSRDQAERVIEIGPDAAHDLYVNDEIITAMEDAGWTVDTAEKVLDRYLSAGVHLSRHQLGKAWDCRIYNQSDDLLASLRDAGDQLGYNVVQESDHDHYGAV